MSLSLLNLIKNPHQILEHDFLSLFLNDTPLIDLRAPVEFEAGSFPNAHNLFLLDDSERSEIGFTYKQAGENAAIEKGLKLVSGENKKLKLAQWISFIEKNPKSVLFCFRGGLRSRITQTWLYQAGINIPIIAGGEKSLRQFLLRSLNEILPHLNITVLSGLTGSGKTDYLYQQIDYSIIDLEALANHRGSAFGSLGSLQPTQINFENKLIIQLLKLFHQGKREILIEDESRRIGTVVIPKILFDKMSTAPVLVLEKSVEERASYILKTYIEDYYLSLLQKSPDTANHQFADFFLDSFKRIKKKLGGVLYQQCVAIFTEAHQQHLIKNDFSLHLEWIILLLSLYYDKMYLYHMNQQKIKRTVTLIK